MTASEYLEQYETATKLVRRFDEEYKKEALLIDAIRSASDNDGMPHGSNVGRPTEVKAIKLVDKHIKLLDAKIEALRIRQEIFDTVMKLGGLEADVIIERYLNLDEYGRQQTWESVCDQVHYSWPTVRTAWHRGMDSLEALINTRTYNSIGIK